MLSFFAYLLLIIHTISFIFSCWCCCCLLTLLRAHILMSKFCKWKEKFFASKMHTAAICSMHAFHTQVHRILHAISLSLSPNFSSFNYIYRKCKSYTRNMHQELCLIELADTYRMQIDIVSALQLEVTAATQCIERNCFSFAC